jgi:hypothetical protein
VLLQSMRGAVKEGSAGAAWEMRLFGSEWGFELGMWLRRELW